MTSPSRQPHRPIGLGLLLGLATSAAVLAQDSGMVRMYRLTELTGDGTGRTRAYSLNNTGQAVGWAEVDSTRRAAHWHNQVGTDLAAGTVHFQLLHPFPYFDQDYSEVYDISDADQIVGTARTALICDDATITLSNAFVLRPAVLSDLGTPYPGDALTNLGTFGNPCIAPDSAATGISNRGHVVGWADREDRVMRAFLVVPEAGAFYGDADENQVNDRMIDLGTLVGNADPVSSATAVNDAGLVTGYSYTTTSGGLVAYRAFLITPIDTDNDGVGDLWFSGQNGVNDLMVDLGTLGGSNSWGRDINNAGDIVGETDFTSAASEHYTRAFLWRQGTLKDLGTLHTDRNKGHSAASAANDKGAVVGWAENDDGARRAFLFENGAMTDLNTLLYLRDAEGFLVAPSIVLTEARDINEDGLIVGWGTLRGADANETRGFLLAPVLVDPNDLVEEDTAVPANPDAPRQGGDYSSTTDFGAPVQAAGTTDTTQGPAETEPATRSAGFCGAAALSVLPLILGGLLCLRGRRPRCPLAWSIGVPPGSSSSPSRLILRVWRGVRPGFAPAGRRCSPKTGRSCPTREVTK